MPLPAFRRVAMSYSRPLRVAGRGNSIRSSVEVVLFGLSIQPTLIIVSPDFNAVTLPPNPELAGTRVAV